jgi:arylsulfatase A-like enzyme
MTVTGQYGQNNGVQNNNGPFGGFPALKDKDNTLATWLHDAGYQTALVGKYLNGYESPNTPPVAGWTRWNPSVAGIYDYFGTTFLDGTGTRTYAKNVTPVIADYTDDDVRAFSATGDPFFIWVSHLPPHGAETDDRFGPPKPSARHAHDLSNVALPSLRKPSFNVSGTEPVPYPTARKLRRDRLQAAFTARIRSLQDVDDAVQRLVTVLQDTDELSSTYIIFVSDNGMMIGEHRLNGKNRVYHEDLRVPLIVRPPGDPGDTAATTSTVPVTTVDLAPTIAELAGVQPARLVDGQSFAPLLGGGSVGWRDTQLIQTGSSRTDGPEPGWDFRGVWTERYTYVRRSEDGAEFLFDRTEDPFELHNVAPEVRYLPVLEELRRRREVLVTCAGASCRQDFGPVPEPARSPGDRAQNPRRRS